MVSSNVPKGSSFLLANVFNNVWERQCLEKRKGPRKKTADITGNVQRQAREGAEVWPGRCSCSEHLIVVPLTAVPCRWHGAGGQDVWLPV
jgi:hypothetical protein